MYPMKLIPAFKDYIWGGTRLKTDFNKHSPLARLAESWELSCHKDGESVIGNGEYEGLTLNEYIKKEGRTVLGTACEKFTDFPVLIKLIDAKQNLSVQVHPDDEYALAHEGEYGKTEMWYVIDCDDGAELICGLRKRLTREELADCIKNGTLLETVNHVPVKKGDVFFIEAGTVHAIGKGILIAEIQQNSNSTYRLFDYNRVGADGKPRPLHTEKGVDVARLAPQNPYQPRAWTALDGCMKKNLYSCRYFTTELIKSETNACVTADETSFSHLLILDGEGEADGLTFAKGDSVFLPAGYGECRLIGSFTAILTYVSK